MVGEDKGNRLTLEQVDNLSEDTTPRTSSKQ